MGWILSVLGFFSAGITFLGFMISKKKSMELTKAWFESNNYHFEYEPNKDKEKQELLDEIAILKLQNSMLRKGNFFTAFMVNRAAKRLTKLYIKMNKVGFTVNVNLPIMKKDEKDMA
jgi:hypothetical protein